MQRVQYMQTDTDIGNRSSARASSPPTHQAHRSFPWQRPEGAPSALSSGGPAERMAGGPVRTASPSSQSWLARLASGSPVSRSGSSSIALGTRFHPSSPTNRSSGGSATPKPKPTLPGAPPAIPAAGGIGKATEAQLQKWAIGYADLRSQDLQRQLGEAYACIDALQEDVRKLHAAVASSRQQKSGLAESPLVLATSFDVVSMGHVVVTLTTRYRGRYSTRTVEFSPQEGTITIAFVAGRVSIVLGARKEGEERQDDLGDDGAQPIPSKLDFTGSMIVGLRPVSVPDGDGRQGSSWVEILLAENAGGSGSHESADDHPSAMNEQQCIAICGPSPTATQELCAALSRIVNAASLSALKQPPQTKAVGNQRLDGSTQRSSSSSRTAHTQQRQEKAAMPTITAFASSPLRGAATYRTQQSADSAPNRRPIEDDASLLQAVEAITTSSRQNQPKRSASATDRSKHEDDSTRLISPDRSPQHDEVKVGGDARRRRQYPSHQRLVMTPPVPLNGHGDDDGVAGLHRQPKWATTNTANALSSLESKFVDESWNRIFASASDGASGSSVGQRPSKSSRGEAGSPRQHTLSVSEAASILGLGSHTAAYYSMAEPRPASITPQRADASVSHSIRSGGSQTQLLEGPHRPEENAIRKPATFVTADIPLSPPGPVERTAAAQQASAPSKSAPPPPPPTPKSAPPPMPPIPTHSTPAPAAPTLVSSGPPPPPPPPPPKRTAPPPPPPKRAPPPPAVVQNS